MKAIHLTYIALMALLAATVAASFLHAGLWLSEGIGIGIGALKAVLIAGIFMNLRKEGPGIRFFAVGALVWVGLLVFFITSDYGTRGISGVLGK